jgi:hypothetical protein
MKRDRVTRAFVHFWRENSKNELVTCKSGTDVMILKVFLPTKMAEKLILLLKILLVYANY